jgi:hypothetical protein
MTKYARLPEGRLTQIKKVLKGVASLSRNPSLKGILSLSGMASRLLESLSDKAVWEHPMERLIRAEGLYFIVMKNLVYKSVFADDKLRLPIYRTWRDAAVAMDKNGWKAEDNYEIIRIDLVTVKSKLYSRLLEGRYKRDGNEEEEDLSGDD